MSIKMVTQWRNKIAKKKSKIKIVESEEESIPLTYPWHSLSWALYMHLRVYANFMDPNTPLLVKLYGHANVFQIRIKFQIDVIVHQCKKIHIWWLTSHLYLWLNNNLHFVKDHSTDQSDNVLRWRFCTFVPIESNVKLYFGVQ